MRYRDESDGEREYEERMEYEAEQRHLESIDAQARAEAEQEPNVVPCSRCNTAMHQEGDKAEENLCTDCKMISFLPSA